MTESKIKNYIEKTTLPNETAQEWLWKREAAEVLEVTEKTLERRANGGLIAQMQKDRKTYYSVSDLIKFETEKDSETIKAIPVKEEKSEPIQTDLVRQTQTDSFDLSMSANERMINAQLEKAEADAKKAVYEGNLTFALDHAAELFNLSIVDLKTNAKIFRGRSQKLMITKKNLEDYLNNL